MRVLAVLAVAFVLSSAYFGVRLFGIEQRLGAIKRQLGKPASVQAADPTLQPNTLAAPGASQAQRVEKLEAAVRALEEQLRAEKSAPRAQPGVDSATGDDQILSVVTREQTRVFERQLQYHRSRWMEGREAALKYFTQHYNVSAQKSTALRGFLTGESDQLIALMRRPHAFENPDQLANDWLATLARTDTAVAALLDPTQRAAWSQARLTERLTLWPWLPNEAVDANGVGSPGGSLPVRAPEPPPP